MVSNPESLRLTRGPSFQAYAGFEETKVCPCRGNFKEVCGPHIHPTLLSDKSGKLVIDPPAFDGTRNPRHNGSLPPRPHGT